MDDEPFGVPSLWLMSWYDVSIGPNLALFNHILHNAGDAESVTTSSPSSLPSGTAPTRG